MLWLKCFPACFPVGQIIKSLHLVQLYSIDSFPISVCHKIRIARSKIVQGEEYRGYCDSKRDYFIALKYM